MYDFSIARTKYHSTIDISKYMKEYQHKHIARTIFYSPATIVILFLILMFLLRSIVELNDKRIEVANLKNDSEIKKEELQNRVTEAETKNININTPRGFEEYVRTTQPVVKDGEGVIVVYDSQGSSVIPVRKAMDIWEYVTIWWQKFFENK